MTPKQLLAYRLPLFDGLSPADFGKVSLGVTEQRLAAGQTLIDQQDDSCDIYFLLTGSLLAVFWTPQGREIVYSRFPIGSYVGELAAFDGAERSLAVIAKTDIKVLIMTRQTFLQLFDEVAAFRQRITQNLVDRIRVLTERNMEMAALSVDQRVQRYILRLAMADGKLMQGGVIGDAPTHAEIAGSVGANREMVSRAISKLAKRGIIKSARQKIEILDPAALAEDSV